MDLSVNTQHCLFEEPSQIGSFSLKFILAVRLRDRPFDGQNLFSAIFQRTATERKELDNSKSDLTATILQQLMVSVWVDNRMLYGFRFM